MRGLKAARTVTDRPDLQTPRAGDLLPSFVASFEGLIRAIVRDEQARCARGSASYSQAELPPGCSKNNYLRICREHGAALGVVSRGKTRLVSVQRWDAWVASQTAKPRLRLLTENASAPSGVDAMRNALGLASGAR